MHTIAKRVCSLAGATLASLSLTAGIAHAQETTNDAEPPLNDRQENSVNELVGERDASVTTNLFDDMSQVEEQAGLSGLVCPENIVLSLPATANSYSFALEDVPFGYGNLGNFAALNARPDTRVKTVPYNASWWTSAWTYNESRDMAVASAQRIMERESNACPNAKFHMYGYSEGADATSVLIDSIAHGRRPISPDKFGSAALIANPSRNAAAPQGGQLGAAQGGHGFFPARDYGQLTDRTLEVCNLGDAVCNTNVAAPDLYHEHVQAAMQNTAIWRGKFADNLLWRLNESMKPETALPAIAEVPGSVLGWGIHIASYPLGGFAQGTGFINNHL